VISGFKVNGARPRGGGKELGRYKLVSEEREQSETCLFVQTLNEMLDTNKWLGQEHGVPIARWLR